MNKHKSFARDDMNKYVLKERTFCAIHADESGYYLKVAKLLLNVVSNFSTNMLTNYK